MSAVEPADFALGDILSITTGALVSRDHIGGVYRILNHMTGDDLFTHQLPRACDECKPWLLAEHPQLVDITVPDFNDDASVWRWLTDQEARFGGCLRVTPVPASAHEVINPLRELGRMAGPENVLPIVVK